MSLIVDSGTALVDGSTWQTALMERMSTTMTSTLNEFGISAQVIFAPTSATVSYEKDAIIVQCEQHDPSDPKNNVLKMSVAGDFRNKIAGNNPSGYAYGVYIEVGCDPGSDGELSGLEIGGNNQGAVGAPYGTFGAKGLLTLVAGEGENCKDMTNAMSIVPGSAKFLNGIIIETAAVVPGADLLQVLDNTTGQVIFAIKADGTLQCKGVITLP